MAETSRRSGALRERLHCQRRQDADDGWGNVIPGAGDFATEFTVYASLKPLRGSEAVQAARLEGRQPFVVTLRNTSQSRQITSAWRLIDARNPNRILAVASPFADPDGKRAWIEGLAIEGAVP